MALPITARRRVVQHRCVPAAVPGCARRRHAYRELWLGSATVVAMRDASGADGQDNIRRRDCVRAPRLRPAAHKGRFGASVHQHMRRRARTRARARQNTSRLGNRAHRFVHRAPASLRGEGTAIKMRLEKRERWIVPQLCLALRISPPILIPRRLRVTLPRLAFATPPLQHPSSVQMPPAPSDRSQRKARTVR
jgi:hypothetical protein